MEFNKIYSLCFLILVFHNCSCLYFIMNKDDKKTFLEDVPIGTSIVGVYSLETMVPGGKSSETSKYSIHVEVINSEDTSILSR
ncbi:hypothetical protein A3Q56_07674, partial [Intoshia linei]